ncbi:MAG: type III-B CRISPR module-associated protein Cmr5 [Acidobacteriota bacterium]|nr:type III-B CRISPR module-associated protein Cmr5 [Acidobacteriota bacterium]
MPNDNLDHLRARFTEKRVAQHFAPWKTQDEAREYRSVALGTGAQLRQSGILQLVAFWLSKNREAERLVLQDLLSWLKASPVTAAICRGRDAQDRQEVGSEPQHPHEVMGPLLARTSLEIAALEAEADAFFLWLKRLTEGFWHALPPRNRGRGEADRSDIGPETKETER